MSAEGQTPAGPIQSLSTNVEELQRQVQKLTAERNAWKDAWFTQCEATGKCYWDGARYGYAQGIAIVNKLVAILNNSSWINVTTMDEKLYKAGMPNFASSSGHVNKSPYNIG